MIILNLNILNKMIHGVSKEATRYWLQGIHIFDREGLRYYESTDGHILFRATAPIKGDALPADYIIKMQSAIKSKCPECELVLADKETAVIKSDTKNAFDIIDGNFPPVDNIIIKNGEPAKEYAIFAPDLLEKLVKFHGEKKFICNRPIMNDCKSPAQWEWEDESNQIKYIAIIMPMMLND